MRKTPASLTCKVCGQSFATPDVRKVVCPDPACLREIRRRASVRGNAARWGHKEAAMPAVKDKNASRFPSHREPLEGGRWKMLRSLKCSRCGEIDVVPENTEYPLPSEMLAKKFVQRGWRLTAHEATCPSCRRKAGAVIPPPAPPAVDPSPCGAAECVGGCDGAPDLCPAATLRETLEPAMSADPPRESTPADRRRIREALDGCYDEDKGRYRQSFSDKVVAANLKLPAAWVTALREAMGLGPDANEANAVRNAELRAVQDEMAKLQTELLARFDALEARLRKLTAEERAA